MLSYKAPPVRPISFPKRPSKTQLNTMQHTLPPLPYAEWEPTKNTLHLWLQIVGKVKLASAPPKNHWWHVPLYLDVHGLTTRLLPPGLWKSDMR